MALTPELSELACNHARCAELARSAAMRDLERSVCGCDYGGTSGTTRGQAEQIAALLGVLPGERLLEIGAGTGWPGLYIAQLTGCDVVMVDLPLESLRIARERAAEDGLAPRCDAVVADGTALPFSDASFDAVSHSDVLCCTPDKVGVLRACRRVARDDARMVFTVIAPAPSLTDDEHRIAIEAGPKFVDVDDDYEQLLAGSGWCVREKIDMTAALLDYMRAELEGMEARAPALGEVFGSEGFGERLRRQRATIDALDAGLLRRELFVALAGR